MDIESVAKLVLLLPFLMFVFLGLTAHKFSAKTSSIIGTAAFSVVAVICHYIAIQYFFGDIVDMNGLHNMVNGEYQQLTIFSMEWLRFSETLAISIGFYLDPISAMMLIVISTVSLMVHIYSSGYMFEHGHYDEGTQRYYAVLSLFSFAMLGLVLATNIFQIYIFWELVGVSSFLLIGYYFTKPAAVSACKKAFIVTRFADMFFLIGILIVSYYTGTFEFDQLNADNAALVHEKMGDIMIWGLPVTSLALLFIFLGGAGKSAMFPFHIWLPDAMEGPTPSSALIHAATMVVAGVYLVARLFPVYSFEAPDVLNFIAYLGAFTALFSAVIACAQTDIKRVLAFSTISQIAYMMVALGVARIGEGEASLGYTASMWHLFTHAMFKAMLFLCCGCIIHCIESNEMTKMGGLWKHMKKTGICFAIGCLAISGIPPFSGFFSKDEILASCFEHDMVIYVCMTFVAGLTAFYMFRLFYRIFFYENDKDYGAHAPHDQGWNMTLPLIVFAIYSCVCGFFPFGELVTANRQHLEIETNTVVATVSIIVAIVGILIATVLFYKKNDKPAKIESNFKGLCTAAAHRFYIDECWYFITRKIIFGIICSAIAWFDRHIIDGFMNLLAWITGQVSEESKEIQSGSVQQYAWIFIMGAIAVVAFSLYY